MTRNKNRSTRFGTIALMGNPQDRRTLDSMQVLTTHLLAAGLKVQASDSLRARALPKQVRRVPDVKIAHGADLVIAIGGDGSMLYAARRIAGRKTPLLGINRGRLGFLADVGPEQMLAKVDEVLAGKYVSEQRMLLLVDLRDGDEFTLSYERISQDGRYVQDGEILAARSGEIAALAGASTLVELGAGSADKTRLLPPADAQRTACPPSQGPPVPFTLGGFMRLEDFPRPKNDNRRGVHWSASVYHPAGAALDFWISELQAMKIKWVKVLDDSGGSSLELCRGVF